MRNHNAKYERMECGEGPTCDIAWGPIIGGGLGLIGSIVGGKKQADAMERAADKNAENARPKYYGPGMQYIPGLLGDAQRLYKQGGFAPPVNPLELLGRQNALGYAEGRLPGLIDATQQSWLTGLNPSLNPYVGSMIESAQQDLTQDFLRNVMPAISDNAQSVGGYGGSRQGVAQGIASEGLLEGLGDISTRLLSNAYGQGLQQQRAAWNMAPQMLQMGLMPSQLQQDIGGLYRGDARQPAENLMGYSQFLSPYFNPGGGFQSNYQAGPNPWAQGLAGAGVGMKLGQQLGNVFGSSFNPTPNVTNPVPGDAYMPGAGYTPGLFGF